MSKSNGKYLTVQEFAKRVGISEAAVYLAIKEKRIGCISAFGERKAIPAEELDYLTRRSKTEAKQTKVLRRDRFDLVA
ncbi:MAG TPA: hypothetical protein VL866_24420 [Pyrinomonadaceae bacterium]|jgi:excisionase family DNA binding protein|nr:hypothetical protein [Pyrinomonadaceae bacterium]